MMSLTIVSATSPRYTDAAQSSIDLQVVFKEFGSELLPFTAHPHDQVEHGRTLYQNAQAGDYGPVAAFEAPPVATPKQITAFQAKAALLNAGLLDQVEAMMVNPTTPAFAQLAWREAPTFEINSPTLLAMAALIPLTAQQLNDMFVYGHGVRA